METINGQTVWMYEAARCLRDGERIGEQSRPIPPIAPAWPTGMQGSPNQEPNVDENERDSDFRTVQTAFSCISLPFDMRRITHMALPDRGAHERFLFW